MFISFSWVYFPQQLSSEPVKTAVVLLEFLLATACLDTSLYKLRLKLQFANCTYSNYNLNVKMINWLLLPPILFCLPPSLFFLHSAYLYSNELVLFLLFHTLQTDTGLQYCALHSVDTQIMDPSTCVPLSQCKSIFFNSTYSNLPFVFSCPRRHIMSSSCLGNVNCKSFTWC